LTRKQLVNSLRERGIQRVYGRSLSRCRKDELDEYFRGIVGSQFGSRSYSINEIEQYLRCPLSYYFVNGKNERDAARDFRLTAYALFMAADGSGAGVEAMHLWEKPAGPVSESQVRLDVLVVGRKPRAQKTESCRTSGDFNHLLRVSAMAVDGISKRAFPPAHPANWSCSPRWCGYYTACRGTR